MKRFIIIISLFFIFLPLYSEVIPGDFNYYRMSEDEEPVKWSLKEGIYFDTIQLDISCTEGEIYYIINGNFSEKEPRRYTKKIILKGISGSIIDYDILVILEKPENSVEFYSRKYRIDRTGNYVSYDFKKKEKKSSFSVQTERIDNNLNINYSFLEPNYDLKYSKDMEFIFPPEITEHKENKESILLEGKENSVANCLVYASYIKNEQVFTEINEYTIDLKQTNPPSFGNLNWGQIYEHDYELKILPDKNTDKIYYWIREWQKDELIFGPPPTNNLDKWHEYTEPIKLITEYGINGITGLAAFSIGENNIVSEITGPFYFKINGVDNTIEQILMFNQEEEGEKEILFNNEKISNDQQKYYDQFEINFKDHKQYDKYYFTYHSRSGKGRSGLLKCSGKYTFTNNDIHPMEIRFFYENKEEIAVIELVSSKMKLPEMKNYTGNYVEFSEETVVDYYLPGEKVRYEITLNEKEFLRITNESQEFKGSFKFSAEQGEEKLFKVKFGSFDENNNLVAESDEFYYRIDRRKPVDEIKAEGVDLKIFHNESQELTLVPPEKNVNVYYRINTSKEWTLYEEPITFNPPLYGKFSAKIYVKSVDEANNTRENNEPFEIFFDTRAIYIDSDNIYNGNGTEAYPGNSLEKAIEMSKEKNIKLIYVLSGTVNLSFPVVIDSDIIIQAKNSDRKSLFVLDTKSLWQKKHLWFDIEKAGYFELRNIDFKIMSGNSFLRLDKAKAKLYSVSIKYTGSENFTFIDNYRGKIGIYKVNIEIPSYPGNIDLFKSIAGYNIINELNINANVKKINVFDVNDVKQFVVKKLVSDINVLDEISMFSIKDSTVQLYDIDHKQAGEFKNSILIDCHTSNISLSESGFNITGENAFNIKLIDQIKSSVKIYHSDFIVDKSTSIIAFNQYNGEIIFERSLLDIKNILDYAYCFRGEFSGITLKSSIIRNYGNDNAINFLLKNCNFKGVNNSIFNINNTGRAFNFWVTDNSIITSVNSIYYFNTTDVENSFIYLNSDNYDIMKPVWYSNVISKDVYLLENMDKKDSNNIVKDYIGKNIYMDFTDEFDVKADDFYIPKKDSPILQGGIHDSNSPVKIPGLDYYGNKRIIPGIGIDIGAIQKSGT